MDIPLVNEICNQHNQDTYTISKKMIEYIDIISKKSKVTDTLTRDYICVSDGGNS